MKYYIVFDLEWNQSPDGREKTVPELPFEIIELGAVKLDEEFQMVDEFHRLIRPRVYRQLHSIISEVTHMDMRQLKEQGEDFPDAARAFLQWCGDEAVYCTWGAMDLLELQRNLAYYGVKSPFPMPLFYYDVQKLYGLFCMNGEKPSLDKAVEELGLLENRPFHRALDDAYYTGQVLACLAHEPGEDAILVYKSIDYYRLPADKKEEIRVVFPGYSKFVSRVFDTKEEAMEDRDVTEMQCYLCGRTLRKKVRWFTPNQKIYYGLAVCPEHGYLKGKLRVKRAEGERIFMIRTMKLTDESGAEEILLRQAEAHRRRNERNKAKRKRQWAERRKAGRKVN
ncbi:MAG: 3'-5' exonuclease [Eubacteriales bacterium]|nr:3'-5' exonuclease [Eubacteriales bacterium]